MWHAMGLSPLSSSCATRYCILVLFAMGSGLFGAADADFSSSRCLLTSLATVFTLSSAVLARSVAALVSSPGGAGGSSNFVAARVSCVEGVVSIWALRICLSIARCALADGTLGSRSSRCALAICVTGPVSAWGGTGVLFVSGTLGAGSAALDLLRSASR